MKASLLLLTPVMSLLAMPPAFAVDQAKSCKTWRVEQKTDWGNYIVHASPSGIRIEGTQGGRLVASPPSWTVTVFQPHDKTVFTAPYKEWSERIPASMQIDRAACGPAVPCNIASIPGKRYQFKMHTYADKGSGMSLIYKQKLERDWVENRYITVAADSHALPEQVIEIWRGFLEIPARNSIVLEIYNELQSGEKLYQLKTTSQTASTLPLQAFVPPVGYKPTPSVLSAFFGPQMEDMVKMMLSDD